MKRVSTLIFFLSALILSNAQTDHTIVTQGLTYNPNELTVLVGDNVTIVATGSHPTTEVSEDTWLADGTTPLAGGFGTHTSSFTFQVTEPGQIFYVCDNHVASSGMKGVIFVTTLDVEELSNDVDVNFGAMPIEDGILRYTISANDNDLGELYLVSLGGQKVAAQELPSKEGEINLNVSPGVYVAVLEDRSGKVVYRESITVR